MISSIQITNSSNETHTLGFEFAQHLKPGDIIAFYGELGAGKTEFIKGICNFFKVKEIVNSPTFTIINEYTGYKNNEDFIIKHIDLFRIQSSKELQELGFIELLFSQDSIKLIEWAEKAEHLFPSQIVKVQIKLNKAKENERTFIIS